MKLVIAIPGFATSSKRPFVTFETVKASEASSESTSVAARSTPDRTADPPSATVSAFAPRTGASFWLVKVIAADDGPTASEPSETVTS